VAIDSSADALHAASASIQHSHGIHFLLGDAMRLPLACQSADVVISLETLEHLAHGESFLDEAHRILKPAGTFVCSTPNRAVTHPGAPLTVRPINRFHVQEYSVDELRSLLTSRFRQVQLYGQNPQARSQRRVMRLVARILPWRWTAYLNQLLKLRRFLLNDPSLSVVVPVAADWDYEYIVGVCLGPIERGPDTIIDGPQPSDAAR
jgi:SAM-dependent methyltransferase